LLATEPLGSKRLAVPTILLIRHAQASYGEATYDVLSDLGREQAVALDAALVKRGVDVAVSVTGPARRHGDTARLCERAGAVAGLSEDARWDEYDTDAVLARHGSAGVRLEGTPEINGLPSRDFQGFLDAALEKWLRDGDASPQSWKGYVDRVSTALDELSAGLERGQTAVVFTSAGAIAAACGAVLDLPARSFVALNRVQVNTGITKIVRGLRGTSLVSFNEHSHLEEAGRFLVTYR
jgi:broad specificity phosphatase PhoE